ncbi:hypothetical protein [Christiangramia forsetii]|uniref:Uncharacterized protein n=1 Tax=Christiangramia forsetii (strain DSM 17595 / CGMCC 1.15422 / KT0803) TaxID=411154 RepID=A0M315_CHRFK|nr:hypothetical protein [Christiangramia forsetii]CAL67010.1 hypothetical protein GFO_2045 [Christiangramia forsetii KT0803]
MKLPKSYWFYIFAAVITIIGYITGWYFFLLLVFPLGIFTSNRNEK